ncbi:hypothetical protein BDN71DRAFT_249756 [Pleurotus eryngii]|uniref:Uncharacterized protein n=1 Tax=Pleurotus eryngii TaxID=5323 RepID=A0A9P5ZNI9_PLEER|nr:hypothetical protein BDN71DRAFT_249756 [Pleurotus eryngii]
MEKRVLQGYIAASNPAACRLPRRRVSERPPIYLRPSTRREMRLPAFSRFGHTFFCTSVLARGAIAYSAPLFSSGPKQKINHQSIHLRSASPDCEGDYSAIFSTTRSTRSVHLHRLSDHQGNFRPYTGTTRVYSTLDSPVFIALESILGP